MEHSLFRWTPTTIGLFPSFAVASFAQKFSTLCQWTRHPFAEKEFVCPSQKQKIVFVTISLENLFMRVDPDIVFSFWIDCGAVSECQNFCTNRTFRNLF